MSCEEIHALLAESLSWEQDERVLRHLKGCPECSEFCEDLKTLAELTADLQEELPVPPEFQTEVFSRLSQRRNSLRMVVPIFLTIGLLMAGGLYWETNSEPVEQKKWGSIFSAGADDPFSEKIDEETHFLEVVVDESAEGDYILRLPSVIRIKHSDLHEESYVSNVSH